MKAHRTPPPIAPPTEQRNRTPNQLLLLSARLAETTHQVKELQRARLESKVALDEQHDRLRELHELLVEIRDGIVSGRLNPTRVLQLLSGLVHAYGEHEAHQHEPPSP